MKVLQSAVLLLLLMIVLQAKAQQVIEKIEFIGLQKYGLSAAMSFMPVSIGDNFDDASYAFIVRSLFKSGYFEDIRLFRKQKTLIVQVTERPWIASIAFYGNDLISDEDLQNVLQQNKIRVNRSFNEEVFERIRRELQSIYYIQGYYGVKVKTNINKLANGNVALEIVIYEGEVSRIVDINISGNDTFAQEDLLRYLVYAGSFLIHCLTVRINILVQVCKAMYRNCKISI